MSKGKKGKASADIPSNKEDGIISETLNDSQWHCVFAILASTGGEEHLTELKAAVREGHRRLFHVIDKQELLDMAIEDAKSAASAGGGGKKSKMGSGAPAEAIPHVQVCQQAASILSSNEELSPTLLAKLLKYFMLKRRKKDLQEKEGPPKEVESAKPKKGGASGRASKTGKKGKETPAADSQPSVAVPIKPQTSMLKRGEEDALSKYINDEPDNGPSCYFLLTGFTSVELLKELDAVQLHPFALVSMSGRGESADSSACDEMQPNFASKALEVVESLPATSLLHNLVFKNIIVPVVDGQPAEEEVSIGLQTFNILSETLYQLLDQYAQYKKFLYLLDLQPMPTETASPSESRIGAPPVVTFDDAHYRSVLQGTPEPCCTIPLIMSAMIEQVCAHTEESSNTTAKNTSSNSLSNELDTLLLCLEKNNTDNDGESSPNPPVISAEDRILPDFHQHLPTVERDIALETHRKMLSLSNVSQCFEASEEIIEYQHLFNNFFSSAQVPASITLDQLRFYLLLMSLERISLPSAGVSPCYGTEVPHLVFDDCFIPAESFKEVFGKHPQLRDLSSTSSQQMLTKDEILQAIQTVQMSHPYVELCQCKYLGYTMLVAHSGFNGSNKYRHESSLQAPAKVGFQSYLSNYSEQYADVVGMVQIPENRVNDFVVPEDKVPSEENPTQSQQIDDAVVSKITAYDLDGKSLIGQDTMSTLFSSNGTILKGQKYTMSEGNLSVSVWLEDKCSFISSSLQWQHSIPEPPPADAKTDASSNDSTMPSELLIGSFYASLDGELTISTSCYGSSGNQQLPYLPPKPQILDEVRTSSPEAPSQPVAPQKLNKKQLEQQQQLLQQQKLLEEQRAEQQKIARKEYQAKLDELQANNKHPQLFATTHYGLHVHCQVMDVDTTKENSVLVRQSLTDNQKSTSTCFSSEQSRCYLGNGQVIRYFKDGSIIVLAPDGSVFQTASQKQQAMLKQQLSQEGTPRTEESKTNNLKPIVWLVTTPDGKRFVWESRIAQCDNDEQASETNAPTVDGGDESKFPDMAEVQQDFMELPPLQITITTDPVTNEVYWMREDGVVLLYKPDNSTIVQFADGTRCSVTTTSENSISTVSVECPGFASVHNNLACGVCKVSLPNMFKIHCSNTGKYDVQGLKGSCVIIKADGSVAYRTGSRRYNLCHSGFSNLLESQDEAGHLFHIGINGSGSVAPFDKDLRTTAFSPYFFIRDSNGEFFQLVDTNSVSNITNLMDKGESIVLEKTKAVGNYITLIEPSKMESAQELVDIAPYNVKSDFIEEVQDPTNAKQRFGTCIGKGLLIPPSRDKPKETVYQPKFLQFSHFLQRDKLSSEKRDEIMSALASVTGLAISSVPSTQATDDSTAFIQQTDVFKREQKLLRDLYAEAREALTRKNNSAKKRAVVSTNVKNKVSVELSEVAQLKDTIKCKVIPLYDRFPQTTDLPARDDSLIKPPIYSFPDNRNNSNNKDEAKHFVESSAKQKKPTIKQRPSTREPKMKQQIEVSTSEVDFGELKEGNSYRVSISLKNVGVAPCRFKIKQPPATTGIKVLYSPGQIAPGISRPVIIEIFALGCREHNDIRHTVEIITEMNTVLLPILAKVHN